MATTPTIIKLTADLEEISPLVLRHLAAVLDEASIKQVTPDFLRTIADKFEQFGKEEEDGNASAGEHTSRVVEDDPQQQQGSQ